MNKYELKEKIKINKISSTILYACKGVLVLNLCTFIYICLSLTLWPCQTQELITEATELRHIIFSATLPKNRQVRTNIIPLTHCPTYWSSNVTEVLKVR